jgi:hypothetical protein
MMNSVYLVGSCFSPLTDMMNEHEQDQFKLHDFTLLPQDSITINTISKCIWYIRYHNFMKASE